MDGPSIIFTRDAEVGCTYIRDDLNRPCVNIVGYDANALCLDCIDKVMPCGGYVRRAAQTLNLILDSTVKTCLIGWITS